MKQLLALLAFLVAFPATGAIGTDEHRELCDRALGKEKRMVPFEDARLRGYAEEFLRKTEMRGRPVLLCVTDRAGAGAWNDVVESKRGAVFVIGVGRRFVQDLGVHLRAVIAHEVGHVVQGDLNHCIRNTGSLERCELDVDRIAIGWVGKAAALAAIRAIIRWGDEESARHPIAYAGSSELRQRLRVLEGTP
ncbi:MAG: hypothetical protein A3C93_05480 [Candidatus Lloydbacteria bacterium RIFCSPHIGHO2_02_FULL_54_17]|uniref:Peptidase M48 domain-containing protein n=1 Tax=Candidatus Lloydbacteria bacterium RIFCSPHIGHO2_02_FULL_54_17 TaxID=1798664 RepID=A0A1G2DAM8_9BACT|nr:MAG: hypothetical protein A3C93_05480 [Candidatus Lloydbacteria bacterium RIFCSPHIGHO2_02_FULL_54_17]OGZ15523.1 MAG: hypothetical protein A2948_04665 [Candidatus Lloydbacteria bacterium RIFCSPLOWO2_01_FULL_54_18]OGZ16894.1 MAG: hypothetical protein A3H76_05220 [Candidatus Lloydbacteria bacterium RIFCSPLOWO2_02_FULL_54_12]